MRVQFDRASRDGKVGELWVNRKTRISPTYNGDCVTVDVNESIQQSYLEGTVRLIFSIRGHRLLVNSFDVEVAAAGLTGDTTAAEVTGD